MAEDRHWLEAAEESDRPLTVLRLYRWKPAAVSLGRHQRPELSLDVEFCRRRGIPLVVRPTGGRAVFHDRELTYAVVSNHASVTRARVSETYRLMAGILHRSLSGLGVPVELSRRSRPLPPRAPTPQQRACFVAASRYELLVRGRKVAGSAQCRLKRSVLQHGSIPLEIDYLFMSRVLGCEEADLRRHMISLDEACGREVSFEEAAEAVRASFLQTLVPLHSGAPHVDRGGIPQAPHEAPGDVPGTGEESGRTTPWACPGGG
jgi:lipoyl(octanoyl) transferase